MNDRNSADALFSATESLIVRANIGPMPRPLPEGIADPMPSVYVEFENGTSKCLFSFYPDEISFEPEEFVGLNEAQARALRTKKDMDYLMDAEKRAQRGQGPRP